VKIRSVLAAAACLLGILSSHALAIPVLPGSDYDVRLCCAGGDGIYNVVFDGTAQSYLRGDVNVSIDESQTSLGGGLYQIIIDIFGDGDLFPAGEGGAFAEVGPFNPLELVPDFRLDSAILRMFSGEGELLLDAETVSFVANPNPWDGYYVEQGLGIGLANGDGLDIQHVQLEFTVSNVPVPATLALFGLGLAGLGWSRRKKA